MASQSTSIKTEVDLFIPNYFESDEEVYDSDIEVEQNLVKEELQSVYNSEEEAEENNEYAWQSTSSAIQSPIIVPQNFTLKSKDGQLWTSTKTTKCNKLLDYQTINATKGPALANKGITDPLQCFQMFFSKEILEEITIWTNAEIEEKTNGSNKISTFRSTTTDEIEALIGILTLTAALKDNHLATEELFDTSYCGSRYVAAMSRDRFDFLIRHLRMDDKNIRQDLIMTDIFVPIRKIWDIFMYNCRSNYIPGVHLTIDEQLLGFRGHCPFRTSLPNKPKKNGIKLVTLCDSTSRYMIDAIPCLGKCTQTQGLPLGDYYVKELTKSIHGSNRTVTCVNWFATVSLAKNLLNTPYNLSLVGPMRSNKTAIPIELQNSTVRLVGTSMFCYDGPLTLVSYKEKPSKMQFLLSSCDQDGTIHPETLKPNMIHFYNKTKSAVETFEQMCSSMSASRKANRWPIAVFYALLNMAFVNSYIIYCENMISLKQKPLCRRNFMKSLSNSLITPWATKRKQIPTLSASVKKKISDILPKSNDDSLDGNGQNLKKRKCCGFCPSRIRRMTKTKCERCNVPICGEHKTVTCPNCIED